LSAEEGGGASKAFLRELKGTKPEEGPPQRTGRSGTLSK
jgi:hypothetical protein